MEEEEGRPVSPLHSISPHPPHPSVSPTLPPTSPSYCNHKFSSPRSSLLLTSEPLVQCSDYHPHIKKGEGGAVVTFLGVTRDDTCAAAAAAGEGAPVSKRPDASAADADNGGQPGLSYEGYIDMIEKEFVSMTSPLLEPGPDSILSVTLWHRLYGPPVPLGSVCMVLSVCSRHRKEGFDAAAKLMDNLKETLPIWKLEGDRWKQNTGSGRR